MSAERREVTTRDVARAAGVSVVSRLGAVVEVLTTPALTWLFGVPAYGVYTVLAAAVTLCQGTVDCAMTSVLQRVVPQARDEDEAAAAVKWALILGTGPSIVIASVVSVLAGRIALTINAAPADRPSLAVAVILFAWALPLNSLVEVTTAAVRARHVFGPEIRLKVFWEQVIKLGLAAGLGLAGFALGVGWGRGALALALAHLGSQVAVGALGLQLVARFYDVGQIWRAPLHVAQARHMLAYGAGIIPANLLRRALTDLPAILLNRWLPGTSGAVAAGLYGIARKLSSIPQLVRTVFAYVMSPLASSQAAHDRARIAPLFGFATRLATALALPLAAAIIGIGPILLGGFAPGAGAAFPLLVLLVGARAAEAVAGPASSVVEIIGHRARPTINAVLGLIVWLGLAWCLVPRLGATGMAAAVGASIVVSAWAALAQLAAYDRLAPFAAPYWRVAGMAVIGAAVTIGVGLAPWGWVAVLPIAMFSGWATLRYGLSLADRAALGSLGRRLGVGVAQITAQP
ncbi:polysaccharide biosynthesis C-terminal domain-containing protein [Sphingosinicellaceae bacterium]|nr:polysaccharide biosynthesis C-terminal domain-containing protein [Sphingosinicellaceae bacterium]